MPTTTQIRRPEQKLDFVKTITTSKSDYTGGTALHFETNRLLSAAHRTSELPVFVARLAAIFSMPDGMGMHPDLVRSCKDVWASLATCMRTLHLDPIGYDGAAETLAASLLREIRLGRPTDPAARVEAVNCLQAVSKLFDVDMLATCGPEEMAAAAPWSFAMVVRTSAEGSVLSRRSLMLRVLEACPDAYAGDMARRAALLFPDETKVDRSHSDIGGLFG